MSFFKKLKNVASAVSTVRSVTNALSSNNPVGTLASSAINRATRGNTTLSQLNNISQFRNSSLGSIVNGSFMNSSNSVDFTGGTFGANLGGFGGILGCLLYTSPSPRDS